MEEVQDWAAQITPPVLVMHGTEDKLASCEATKRLFEKIGSKDKELIIYPGYYHELFNEPEKHQLYERATQWLSKREKSTAA
jgi:alpha-beta hydrolase superfamily lysophospholipase